MAQVAEVVLAILPDCGAGESCVLYCPSVTYAIGFHDGRGAYLLADSAITKAGRPNSPISTFGEAPAMLGDRVIEEAQLKVVRITPDCLATYAGNVAAAVDFLSELRLDDDPDPRSIANEIQRAQHRGRAAGDSTRGFEIILGRHIGGLTQIVAWSTAMPRTVRFAPAGSGHDAGSLPDRYRTQVRDVCISVLMQKSGAEAPIVMAAALLQQICATNALLEEHVGGAFYGGYVIASGICTHPETLYTFYNATELATVWLADEPPTHLTMLPSSQFVRCLPLE